MTPSDAGADKTRLPAVRPYAVGYAKPPVESRFREGQSGNPRGRPRGSGKKVALPSPSEERMKTLILEEAYRGIPVRDGTRQVTLPMVQAVLRALAVNAVKGQHRAQKLFAELLAAVETSNKAQQYDQLKTAIDYKFDWERELLRRETFNITGLPEPLPHPDHVIVNPRTGTVRIIGPMTREEQAEWNMMQRHQQSFTEQLNRQLSDLRRARRQTQTGCRSSDNTE